MAIIDDLLKLNPNKKPDLNQPQGQPNYQPPQMPQQQGNWVSDLISKRYQPQTERKQYNPMGFEFKRDPFDPSSYYNALGTFKDISRAATAVTMTEASNREQKAREAEIAASQAAIKDASGNINPQFTYGATNYPVNTGKSRHYKLSSISSNTAKAADYFGSRYGIKTIGGYSSSGSVPNSDHPKGLALDYMINNISNGKKTGTALANDVIKNAKAWNVKYVIWYHYIWSPERGWHKYSGPSPHTDHVHVSFNK